MFTGERRGTLPVLFAVETSTREERMRRIIRGLILIFINFDFIQRKNETQEPVRQLLLPTGSTQPFQDGYM